MNHTEMATALAFRILLARNEIASKEVAKVLNIIPSGISKIINFKRDLSFAEMVIFCHHYNISISEASDLVLKISRNKKVLQQIKELKEASGLTQRKITTLLSSIACS